MQNNHLWHLPQLSDSLLDWERFHLLKLGIWAAVCVLVGATALWTIRRRANVDLARHFAMQTAAWGAVNLAIVAFAAGTVAPRELAAVVSLDRFLWLNVGLDVGYVAVGATLALVGWRLVRRHGLIGAGLGVIVQGLALCILDLQLTAHISRG
jgi:hypothetical protein